VIDDWEEASENRDTNRNLNNYADTVDYYKAGRVGLGRVRADKQNAFSQYDSINFNISNMKITPDASGDKATAVFDKEWTFEGDEKYSSGKVQQQLTLSKIGGKWKITGEKDLKVYYTEK
jgi:ketosteroid isomerase-like protein